MTGSVSLRGGSTSISADSAQLIRYSERIGQIATQLARTVIPRLSRLTCDPAMALAATLDPVGAAAVVERTAVSMALLTAILAASTSLQAGLRSAAAAYRTADELDRRLLPLVQAGWQLPSALAVAGVAWAHPRTALQRLLTADPALADVGVALLTLAVMGPAATRPDATTSAARLLATAYPDGDPVLTRHPERAVDDARGAPRSVSDLITGLAVRTGSDDGGGAFDLRILEGPPPAGKRIIVDIAATTIWNFDPLHPTPQASDLGTSLRSMANESSVLQRGIERALELAGVGPDEPIMLVGHSQGGMVAARLATDLTASTRFRVTHLVTAGSPIGLANIPASVSVLALENQGDPVPQLDGVQNPDQANWLTAQLHHGGNSIAEKHSLNSYLSGANDIDSCRAQALTDWRSGAATYLDAQTVRTEVFQVRRAQ